MEQTFITIHNLSPDANILFASESIVDILGYQPQDVLGKTCFDYFHPEEVPFARSVHSRGILLDKAAVLHYARILSRDGQWISCECCFTVVHDVLVASTSIYRRGERSERRAIEAPQIRRIFSCSPRDPRYHMLEHLSPKFKVQPIEREPRAALILNRFTRTLTVMFATNAVASILGVRPDQIQDKSFYECIAENCLADAIKCLESAKANDSIAYLRFWYRDPRREEDFEDEEEEEEDGETSDEDCEDMDSSNGDSNGGAHLDTTMDIDSDEVMDCGIKTEATGSPGPAESATMFNLKSEPGSSPSPTAIIRSLPDAEMYEGPRQSRQSSRRPRRSRRPEPIPTFELEAVVSCTSDGLVVVLRKARPPIPSLHPPLLPIDFENGLFAAPWSEQPIRPYYPPELFYTFRPPLLPQFMPLREHVKEAGGPPIDQLMKSIRDVAVFAWALVGINGNMASYGRGIPTGDAQPPEGLPIWDPNAPTTSYLGPEPLPPGRWPNHPGDSKPNRPSMTSGIPYVPGYVAKGPQSYIPSPGGFGHGDPNRINPAWPASTPYSTRPDSWAYPPIRQHPRPNPPHEYRNHAPPEPWLEASASYTQQNSNSYPISTTQPHAFGDPPPSFQRRKWY
ncbi:hypothetical protein F4775DRAFT_272785 [Biscogniauxia sp. FL1348]|nr:hypothetical protein F4775DRAFT_272785 [Biscogniauxia sp. FL1348]